MVRFILESLEISMAWLNALAPMALRAVPAHVAASVARSMGVPMGVATANLCCRAKGVGFVHAIASQQCGSRYQYGVLGSHASTWCAEDVAMGGKDTQLQL